MKIRERIMKDGRRREEKGSLKGVETQAVSTKVLIKGLSRLSVRKLPKGAGESRILPTGSEKKGRET